jgi:hypothetical protein
MATLTGSAAMTQTIACDGFRRDGREGYVAAMRMLLIIGLVAASTMARAQTTSGSAPRSAVVEPTTQGTSTVSEAAETPLRNANLVRQDIPPVLTAAVADPYARPRPLNCKTLAAGIVALNGALGDDLDAGANPSHAALGPEAVKLAANTFIPWQGVVRFVTGADARDRRVRRAIIAGYTRRAYLKGLGEAKGCGPPAAPLRPKTASYPAPRAGGPGRRRARSARP